MNKFNIIFCFFIFLYSFTTFAKPPPPSDLSKAVQGTELVKKVKEWYFGAKAGLSIPSLQAGESKNIWNKNYQSIVRPYFSVFLEHQLNRNFSVQVEFAYAAQGGTRKDIQPFGVPEEYVELFKAAFETKNDYVFANLESTSHIDFIQVPIMLKYNQPIAMKKRLSVYALVGPYVGYMVSAKQIVKSKQLRVFTTEDESSEIAENLVHGFFGASIDTVINSYPELHKFNMGIQGGVGFEYHFKNSKVFIEGGGNYGMLYLQKGDDHGKNTIGAGTVLLGYALKLRN